MAGISEYERRRQENIERNRQILAQLDIPVLKPIALPDVKRKPVKRQRKEISKPTEDVEVRKSSRLAGVKVKEEKPKQEIPIKEAKPRKPDLVGPQAFEPEEGEEAKLKLQQLSKEAYREVHLPLKATGAKIPVGKRPPMAILGPDSVIKACPARIYSMALHPSPTDRVICAIGDKEGYLSIWACQDVNDPAAGSLFSFRPHRDTIPTVRFNPLNPAEIITCSYDQTVQAVDLTSSAATWSILHRLAEKDDRIICCMDQHEHSLFLSDSAGFLHTFDRRSPEHQSYALHERKVGGLSLCPTQPHLIATCSLDNVVAIWDRRSLKSNEPLISLPYRRAVTAVNWHPTRSDRLVSTCYDDHVRIHRLNPALNGTLDDINIAHNNQTGRWITVFKAIWDPKSTAECDAIILGNMNHGLDVIDGHSATLYNYQSDYLTSQPAVNAAHQHRDLVVSGNARGKLILWTPEQR